MPGIPRASSILSSRRALFAASGLALYLPTLQLAAQVTGTLRGTVVTMESVPIPNARIALAGTKFSTTTRPDGAFSVEGVPVGRHTLQVRRIGYTLQDIPLTVEASVTALEVVLAALPVELTAVEVKARELVLLPGMKGFYERRERGNGAFFDREDIHKMQARQFTDVLRRVPGIQIQPGNGMNNAGATVGRNIGGMGTRPCPMLYYINGSPVPMERDASINNFLSPNEIDAIEVYAGAAQIPAQFTSSQHNSRCGVVVVWTLSGPDRAR